MRWTRRRALAAMLGTGAAAAPLAAAVSQGRRGAGTVAPGDYMSVDLRRKVDALKAAVAATPTNDANAKERAIVLYDWVNAYSMRGEPVHPDTQSAVATVLQPNILSFGERVRQSLYNWIDIFIRTYGALEANPRLVGEMSTNVREPFTVDSYVSFEQTYTVGDAPIGVGGGIVIPSHFYFVLGEPQLDDPRRDNYLTVRCSNPQVKFERSTFDVSGAFSGRLQLAFTPRPFLKVSQGELRKGDTVTLSYGDRTGHSRGAYIIHWSNSGLRFPIWVVTADGLLMSPRELLFASVGGRPEGVRGFAPSTLAANEPFALTVRTEDRFRNLATGRAPAYQLLLNGQPFRTLPATTETLTRLEGLTLPEPGVHRFTIASEDGAIRGEANPILVERRPAERIYWGETHGHCGFSEGMGRVDDYFRFARDEARLDFITLSEHDLWMDSWEWEEIRRSTRAFNKPGEFITYMGYEWTVNSPFGGHHNVIFREIEGVRPATRQHHPTLPELYRGLRSRYATRDVLVIPHAHEAADWTMNDRELEPLVEIVSAHGTFEWIGRNYLANGYQLGFVGASDDHIGHPGYRPRAYGAASSDNFGGLAGVYASRKDRNVLFDAMRDRRTYATNGERIILRASVNGSRMGVVVPSAPTRRIEGSVVGTGPVESITLVKNGRDYRTLSYDAGSEGGPAADELVQVRFWSTTHPPEVRKQSRGPRIWKGRVIVEGAQVTLASAPQAEAHNRLTEYVRIGAQPNIVEFFFRTRGEHNDVRLKLDRPADGVRVRIELDEARTPFGATIAVPPAGAPATVAIARDVDPGAELRAAGTFDDEVSVKRIHPSSIRDRSFSFVDEEDVRDGDNYYVRVVQADGGAAWSSPAWVGAVKRARGQAA